MSHPGPLSTAPLPARPHGPLARMITSLADQSVLMALDLEAIGYTARAEGDLDQLSSAAAHARAAAIGAALGTAAGPAADTLPAVATQLSSAVRLFRTAGQPRHHDLDA